MVQIPEQTQTRNSNPGRLGAGLPFGGFLLNVLRLELEAQHMGGLRIENDGGIDVGLIGRSWRRRSTTDRDREAGPGPPPWR